MKKFFILSFLMLLSPVLITSANNRVIIDKVKQQLAKADTPKDSIRLLYDLWDLSLRKDQMAIGERLYDVAKRAKYSDVQFDILRLMANVTRNDSALEKIETHVLSMPETLEQKETLLFVRLKKASLNSRTLPEKERQKRIAEIITRNDFDKLSKYGKIANLFTICEFLSSYADGDLLIEYMDKLKELMDEADLDSYALKNIYYTEAANIYSYAGEGKRALEADRKLLEIVSQLEKEYKLKGRRYRNYNVSKYIILRRMLSNYRWLSKEEVNDMYSQILELVENDEDVKANFMENRRASAYHAMKNGRYTEAIPYLESNLDRPEIHFSLRKQLYEMLIEAAKKSGDKATLDRASRAYKDIKAEYDSLHTKSRYNELQVRYQVNVLKTDLDRMALENKDAEITSARRIMTFVIVGWVAFGVLLILMVILWTRYKRNTIHIEKFVDSLAREKNNLKSERHGHASSKSNVNSIAIRRQGHSVDGMMNFILNDLLYIAAIGQDDSHIYMEEISVDKFMEDVINTFKAITKKNINFIAKYADPDFNLYVDKECLNRITEQILNLAVRLTPEGGEVGYECKLDETGKNAQFIFWHTGNPLPNDKEELIFNNFITFDTLTGEKEAALLMCRLIHLLLDATIWVDKKDDFAKLTLTIPLHLHHKKDTVYNS